MKLNEAGLQDRAVWEQAGYQLPTFSHEKAAKATREHPFWLHFGLGNIFVALQAHAVQKLMNAGILESGLVAAGNFDFATKEAMYQRHDGYSLLVTLKADGTVEKTVIGSILERYPVLPAVGEADELARVMQNPSLQMVSFTITEKVYKLYDNKGEVLPAVAEDFAVGPDAAKSYMGRVSALLYRRYQAGKYPIAMVCMDNFSHNGDVLKSSVLAFVEEWVQRGFVEADFLAYVNDPQQVSFPWSMIDKITPRPDDSIASLLREDGLEDVELTVTAGKSYLASFVNAEECEYLVIEDAFPNGRPPLEQSGFYFTDRETVNKTECMKVCTCLNPLHTALAVFGCLLGYQRVAEEMKDETLRKLVEGIGYTEGLPVVVDPVILNPKEFIDTVVNVRVPNPFLPDAPQRIATDTSQKLPIRFGETIKAYLQSAEHDVSELKLIPLVFAGWLRYLMAVDDAGQPFELSPDPLLEALKPVREGLYLGMQDRAAVEALIRPVLQNKAIFAVDLYEVGLAERVCDDLMALLQGVGAVRKTLNQAVGLVQ